MDFRSTDNVNGRYVNVVRTRSSVVTAAIKRDNDDEGDDMDGGYVWKQQLVWLMPMATYMQWLSGEQKSAFFSRSLKGRVG
jgi:hypothetical protein